MVSDWSCSLVGRRQFEKLCGISIIPNTIHCSFTFTQDVSRTSCLWYFNFHSIMLLIKLCTVVHFRYEHQDYIDIFLRERFNKIMSDHSLHEEMLYLKFSLSLDIASNNCDIGFIVSLNMIC